MNALFEQFLHFDLSVFQWVRELYTPILDKIMVAITYTGEAGAIFIVLALVLLLTKKYRKAGFAMLIALAVMIVCNNLILKEVFSRPRPFNLELDWWNASYSYPDLVSRPDSFSFPSGHTSSAFAAAFALIWYDRKIGIPTLIYACLMGFSRIYVQVHYCSDVLAGIIVGLLYAIIGILLAKWLFPFFNKYFTMILDKIFKKKKKAEVQ